MYLVLDIYIKNFIKLIHEKVLNNYDIDLILEQEIIAWE